MSPAQLALVFAAFSFSRALATAFFGTPKVDEGLNILNALRLLAGDKPYADFWAIHPFGDWLIPLASVALFDTSVVGMRALYAAMFAGTTALFFLIALRLAPRGLAIGTTLAFSLLFIHTARNGNLLPLFLAVLLFARSIESGTRVSALVAGLVAGALSMFRLDFGIYALGGGMSALLVQDARVARGFLGARLRQALARPALAAAGATLIGGLGILALMLWISPADVIRGLVVQPFSVQAAHRQGFALALPLPHELVPSSLDPAKILDSYAAWSAYAILIVLALAGFWVVRNLRRNGQRHIHALLLVAVGILMLPYIFYWSRPEIGHIKRGLAIALLLFAYLGGSAASWRPERPFLRRIRYLARATLLTVVLLFAAGGAAQIVGWITFNTTPCPACQETVFGLSGSLSDSSALVPADLEIAIEFLNRRQSQGAYTLALPHFPSLYYLSHQTNPIPHAYLAAGYISSREEEARLVVRLRSIAPAAIVYDPRDLPYTIRPIYEFAPQIHSFITEHYTVVDRTPSGWLLMEFTGSRVKPASPEPRG